MPFPPVDGPRIARSAAMLPVAGALALGAAMPAHAGTTALPVPLFTNGGFESPVVPEQAFTRFVTGGTIGAWRVTAGDVDLVGTGYWQAAEGRQSLDLEGSGPGRIEQSLPTRFGGCYAVTFRLAGNPDGGPSLKRGYARVTPSRIGHPVAQKSFTFDTTGRTRADLGYVPRRFHFRAFSPRVTLSFASTTGGGYGPVIDGITVLPTRPLECRLNGD